MTVFETGVLNIPNPSATTLDQAIQQFNQNFQLVDNYCVNKRDVFFETITINNGNSGSTLIKTTKISIIKCVLTNAAINFLLPALNKDGDKFIIYDSENLAATYNITINRNGNLINSASSNYVINKNKGWIELTYINNIGFIISNSSEIYNLLSSDNNWTGDNNFDGEFSIGKNTTNTGLEIGNSNSAGGLSFLDFHYGISTTQDYNVRILNNANESLLIASNTKPWCSFDNTNFAASLNILPTANNTYSLGNSTNKFTEVWATNGTIQTSDKEKKENIKELNLGLDFIMKLKPVSWKWKNEQAYKRKETRYKKIYDENNNFVDFEKEEIEIEVPEKRYKRLHQGLLSNDVKNTLDELKISTNDFAGYIKDSESGEEALRYTYFIAPIIKAIQQQNQLIQELKQEIEILKTR